MKNQKSAKDIAFENERIRFRKQIRELENELELNNACINSLEKQIQEKESELNRYKDWVERLLTYMDMSEEDLKRTLENEKEKEKTMNSVKQFLGLVDIIGGRFGY